MWYDLIVLAFLGYSLLRGAARGLLTQLASIAAIIVCLVFAESFSAAFGPYVSLEPPLNNWVVMFGAYLVCSFIAFGLARVLTDWVEKAKLESFNQHLGAMFGLLKGVLVCLVATFFLVTLSPASRHALSASKSAYCAAYIMDRVHPIMPREINAALVKYLELYELERSPALPGDPALAGPQSPPPIIPPGTPSTAPFPGWPSGGNGSVNSTPPAPVAGSTIEQFLAQLPANLTSDLKWLIGRSLENTPPEQRAQAQQQLWNIVRQARPEDLRDLQQQLLANGRQTLGDAISAWTRSFVAPSSVGTAPGTSPGGYNPQPYPTNPPAIFQPPNTPPPAGGTPPPLATSPGSRQDELLAEISRAFSSIPPVQVQVQTDIRRRLAGLPPEVVQGVLEDWRRDLRQPQAPDPDPGTDATAPLEVRILRQLQSRQIPVQQLSREVQERLSGTTIR